MRYADLTRTERKAKFIRSLIHTGLNKSQLEIIANWRWQIGYKYKDGWAWDHDLIDNMMTIHIHDHARSFANAATLDDIAITHSWAGERTEIQYGNWIIGDETTEFGSHVDKAHSENGSMGTPETNDEEPEFDTEMTQVIVVKTVKHDSLSDQNATFHNETWDLHIFLGKGNPPVDPELQSIISAFSL